VTIPHSQTATTANMVYLPEHTPPTTFLLKPKLLGSSLLLADSTYHQTRSSTTKRPNYLHWVANYDTYLWLASKQFKTRVGPISKVQLRDRWPRKATKQRKGGASCTTVSVRVECANKYGYKYASSTRNRAHPIATTIQLSSRASDIERVYFW